MQQRRCCAVWFLTVSTAVADPAAGISMYSSIMKTKTKPGDWIALVGAGGGLGHLYAPLAASFQR